MNTERFHNIEDIIGYTFHDLELLVTALTHKSYANERKINKVESYERSEFLGDAILEFVVSEYLYKNYPDYPEGKLTKLRASLVCEFTLSQISKELKFGHYVLLSRGEDLTGGRNRNSIMCDLFEAVLGAIYLDGGLANAKEFIHKFILTDIEHKKLFYDCKTSLQEVMQGHYEEELNYRLISEEGPDHDKRFSVEARIGERVIGTGIGHTKKAAEQEAAYQALLLLKPVQKK